MKKMTEAELAQALKKHALWLENMDGGAMADLRGYNLSGANLSGANLYRADLSGANLYRADLSGANL